MNFNRCKWNQTKDALGMFLPSRLPDNIKSKVFDSLREDYVKKKVYALQSNVVNVIDRIETIYLLACNDVAISRLEEEYKLLQNSIAILKPVLLSLDKQLNAKVIIDCLPNKDVLYKYCKDDVGVVFNYINNI